MFCPDGYHAIRCDRNKARGGGVAVLYKNNLQVVEVDVPFDKDLNFELVCIDVHNNDSFIRLCCVYLPPSQTDSVVLELCKSLEFVLSVQSPVFIFGDFNFPHIDWSVPSTNGDSAHTIFLNFCSSHALYQSVDFPTHDKGNILDLVLCNPSGKSLLYDTNSQAPPWDTDHFLISFLLNFSPSKCLKGNVLTPDFNKANYDLISADLDLVEWDAIFAEHNSDPQSLYDNFISILNNCISKHVPLKSKCSHKPQRKPKHIKALLKNKHRIYKQLKRDPLQKLAYKNASKAYTSAINQWHDEIEAKLCINPNSNKLYSYANKKLNIRNMIPPLIDDNKNMIFSDIDKANYLNQSFQKFFTKDTNLIKPTHSPPPTFMPNFTIKPRDIIRACKKMKNKISRTPEGIPSLFIKRNINVLVKPLCFLFNHFLKYNFVPKQWKFSFIVPIFKKEAVVTHPIIDPLL